MTELVLKILDKDGNIRAMETSEDYVTLVYTNEYEEGDRIVLEGKGAHDILFQLDEVMGEALCYVTGPVSYQVPFGSDRVGLSPKAFAGNIHYLHARIPAKKEIFAYRNLAKNVYDWKDNTSCYPHAWANAVTRGEAVFEIRNTIDGVWANRMHGEWPYQSWGIDMRPDAKMRVDFGRKVLIDKLVLITRADFPHDNWWKQVTVVFSDDTREVWNLTKQSAPHILEMEGKEVEWVQIEQLIQSEEPSPFPSLTQIEIYGTAKAV